MSIATELAAAEHTLAAAGVETARHDAEWLAARALNCRRSEVLANAENSFPNGAHDLFEGMLARRTKREPLAYITGTVVFRGIELEVGPGCLVPRPETEITTQRAIARAREHTGARPNVVDVGTGCGAIALAIAAEVPDARIFAIERSATARGWALRNLARTGLRCTLLPGSLLNPLHPALGGGISVVVANPPYVSEAEWGGLEPEVRNFEPKEAVVGGPSGLELITEIAEQARLWLATGAWLVMEIAPAQAAGIQNLLTYLGYSQIEIAKDLAGRERVVEARWFHL